ncbi:MAG TPA: hypothetical protein VLC53_01450 [Myxococcota bacterium]|nr:hypothetical protein [Myxococcota bacterium]
MRLACAIACAVFLAAAAAGYRYDVREWSADWEGFSDDFEDGVLPAGGPGEAPVYLPICGVTGESETGGALQLAGPDPLCPAQPGAILATTGGATVGETRATFRFQIPDLGESYGLTVSDQATSDFVSLVLARNPVPGLFPDALLVVLLADPFVGDLPTPVAFSVLSTSPPHSDVSGAALELRLVTAPGPGGALPTGTYRLCAASPCEDESTTPFQSLAPAIPPSADGGALLPDLAHGPTLVAFSFGEGDFLVEVEEWSTRGSASDDFESPAFADTTPYSFSCGAATNVEQANGVLSLVGPVAPCGGNTLGFLAGFPGPLAIRASFDFVVPGPCEAYGVSAGSGASDFAFLGFARSPDPLDPESGSEALYVRLGSEPEAGGPAIPIVASARVSGDPLADPALADVTSIELELDLSADLAGLVPSGRFRLCTETGCPPAFTLLEPSAPAADLDPLLCGVPATGYDPPADGLGALAWEGPVGAALVATRVPEAGAAASAAAALLALLGLLARPRTSGRNRCPTKI